MEVPATLAAPPLRGTDCAICGPDSLSRELYPASFDESAFASTVFSARRAPDRTHYRFVRCLSCGLVRSDPTAPAELVARLYKNSGFTYDREVPNLKATYGRYLSRLDRYGVEHGALLEIGCGSGFFLEEALARGYARVQGVEPSREAVASASASIRPFIMEGVLEPGGFGSRQFDVIGLFQVIDHIADPAALLEECARLLTPRGCLLCVTHDVESWSARLLGERSPIVDIEHTFLFAPRTLSRLLGQHGFDVREAGTAVNRYSIGYLLHMLPAPAGLKHALERLAEATRLDQLNVTLPLGNMYVIASAQAG